MSAIDVSAFDKIIRKVKDIPELFQGESVVRINSNSLKYENKKIISFFGQKQWIYIVGSSGTSRHIAECKSKEFEIR